jgi:hypothetical protein
VGIHVLGALVAARFNGVPRMFDNLGMFQAVAGTKRLHRMLVSGSDGAAIISAWQNEVAHFKAQRGRYLIY